MDSFMLETGISIVRLLQESGYIAYFAGGWVRDYVMKQPSDDIDIVTSASVEEIQKIFTKTIPVGIAFGIVIVVQEGYQFEVATFRKDIGILDGRRPIEIDTTTPQEDAQRRDFTINGLFYDPISSKIHDFVEGVQDIQKGVIRAIGNPVERFTEDRLRMVRAVRYATRLNFVIEQKTLEALIKQSETLMLSVSVERIYQELKKMNQFHHLAKSLWMLYQFGLLRIIFPKLQNYPQKTIEHNIETLHRFSSRIPLFIQILEIFPQWDQEFITDLHQYFKLSKTDQDLALLYYRIKTVCFPLNDWKHRLEQYEWCHFYAHQQSSIITEAIASLLKPEDSIIFLKAHYQYKNELKFFIECIQKKDPLVRSYHLVKEGIIPGKKMGILLKEAEKISMNQKITSSEEVIHRLKKTSYWTMSF